MYSIRSNHQLMYHQANSLIKYSSYGYQSPRNLLNYYRKNDTSQSVSRTLCTMSGILQKNEILRSDLLYFSRSTVLQPCFPASSRIIFDRQISSSCIAMTEFSKPSSKVEETVTALKEKVKEKEDETKVASVKTKKSLKQKVVDELVHYYHGFKLLFIDLKISSKLLGRVLKGNQLSRREHNLLVRTVSDLFRLVPFSVFIIVPFMELLLPVFIKLFPSMLPSTFQTAEDKDDKMKKSLKVKLEMAKFLQRTLDNMSLKSEGHSSVAAKEFAEFCEKVRSEGGVCTSDEIMKFSKLFEDEITLDSLPRPQLVALCRVLELKPIGTSTFLRFQLRMKLRNLAADDLMIQKEGIDSLSLTELQQACRSRGMRAYGLSGERLRIQLAQWLDLSINKKVPPSLLLLSRAFMLPETIPTTDKLKATISALPETVAVSTKAAIGEREGKVDNKTKIEIIKEEERKIKEEREEIAEEKRKALDEQLRLEAETLVDKASELIDKAVDLEPDKLLRKAEMTKQRVETVRKKLEEEDVTSEDVRTLQEAMEVLAKEKKSLQVEKEELEELKEEIAEYKEDVADLQHVIQSSDDAAATNIHESKGAQRLYKKVSSMIQNLDLVVNTLEKKEKNIKDSLSDKKGVENEELLRIDELMNVIRKIQKIPDEGKLEKIAEVLSKIDEDKDGSIRIDTVLKVVEEIDEGNVKLSPTQFSELVDLLEKEAILEESVTNEKLSATKQLKNNPVVENEVKDKFEVTPRVAETTTPVSSSEKAGKNNSKSETL